MSETHLMKKQQKSLVDPVGFFPNSLAHDQVLLHFTRLFWDHVKIIRNYTKGIQN